MDIEGAFVISAPLSSYCVMSLKADITAAEDVLKTAKDVVAEAEQALADAKQKITEGMEKNDKIMGEDAVISTPDSKVTTIVVTTDEEYVIAMDTMKLVQGK